MAGSMLWLNVLAQEARPRLWSTPSPSILGREQVILATCLLKGGVTTYIMHLLSNIK